MFKSKPVVLIKNEYYKYTDTWGYTGIFQCIDVYHKKFKLIEADDKAIFSDKRTIYNLYAVSPFLKALSPEELICYLL